MALFSSDPTDEGLVVSELVGDGYARLALTGLFPATVGTEGIVANTSSIPFPTATADWIDVTHIGYMESGVSTTDDMMMAVPLLNTYTITNGTAFKLNVGTASIKVG